MIFGIPREMREHELRVGALPFLVKEIVKRGHEVYVETGAGEHCEASDSQYEQVGATIVPSPEKLYSLSEIILKVREPKPVEYDLIRPDQAIFCFFHFLGNAERIKAIASRGCTCLAYESVRTEQNEYPLLLPLSRLCGQLAILNAAYLLQKQNQGRGIVLGTVTGAPPARTTILGAGNVGKQAALTAAHLGADVVVLDIDYRKLVEIDAMGYPNITTLISTDDALKTLLPETDLLVTGVHIPNQPTPKLISPEMVKTMRTGSVIMEVDIDLGGSVETGKVTNHDNPTFVLDGVVHYCVSNITSGVPMVASQALSAALLPYIIKICEQGFESAILSDKSLYEGTVIYKGHIVNPYLAKAAKLPLANLEKKIQELTPDD
ncbi:MAG: alanine dehydrogenase [Calditrichia bacterium]